MHGIYEIHPAKAWVHTSVKPPAFYLQVQPAPHANAEVHAVLYC